MTIQYPEKGVTSIWVGVFPDEDSFDASVEKDVVAKLKLKTPIENICEIAFESESVSVRKLIEGFSGWETFVDEVERQANSQGCERVNAALVCYNLRCDEAPSRWGELSFLGTFSGQDIQ